MFGPDEGRNLKDRTSKVKTQQLTEAKAEADTTEKAASNPFESRPKGPNAGEKKIEG
jgi:hypothetical protein